MHIYTFLQTWCWLVVFPFLLCSQQESIEDQKDMSCFSHLFEYIMVCSTLHAVVVVVVSVIQRPYILDEHRTMTHTLYMVSEVQLNPWAERFETRCGEEWMDLTEKIMHTDRPQAIPTLKHTLLHTVFNSNW